MRHADVESGPPRREMLASQSRRSPRHSGLREGYMANEDQQTPNAAHCSGQRVRQLRTCRNRQRAAVAIPRRASSGRTTSFSARPTLPTLISLRGIRYRPTKSSVLCGRTTTTARRSPRSSPRSPKRRATRSSIRAASICRSATTMHRFRHSKARTSRWSPAWCRRRNIRPSPAPPRSRISARRSCRSQRPLNFRQPLICLGTARRSVG